MKNAHSEQWATLESAAIGTTPIDNNIPKLVLKEFSGFDASPANLRVG